MGKQSRAKKERREIGEIKPKKEPSESGLVSLCLYIIKGATYLSLFTPLIVSQNFFFPFVGPKSLFFMALAEVIFFTWLILIINAPKYRPRLNVLTIFLVLYLIVLILSSVFGANFSNSFWSKPERTTGLLMWFHLFAFFLAISSTFQKRKDWQIIFAISIFVAVILSFITFFSTNPSMKGGATIGNDSFLGTYLIFNLFFALYLILTPNQKFGVRQQIYSGLFFLIMFVGLFLSGARAAKISFLGGLFLLFFLYLIFLPKKNSLKMLGKILLLGSVIVALILGFFLFQSDSIVQQKFIALASRARLVVWEKAWKGFLERPWFGWGPENFDFVFTKYFNPCMFLSECGGEIWFDRAHNIIFDTLVATGIFGLLSYLGIFLSVFYLLWKRYFQQKQPLVEDKKIQESASFGVSTPPGAEDSQGGKFWTVGIFTALLIAYFVQNLTVFDMISSYLMFFLVLGFVAAIVTPRETFSLPKTVSPNLLLSSLILILFCISFFFFIIQPAKTDHYVISALKAPPASEEQLNFYKKTLKASPWGKYQIRDFFGQRILEISQSDEISKVSAESFKAEIDFVIEELEKSIKESPLDFRSHLKLGQLYNVYAILLEPTKALEAERVLMRAIELSPINQQAYWALAQTRLYQGKTEEAISLAEKALLLEPKVFQSHYVIIQIAKITGDEELVKEKIEEALKINPAWEPELKKLMEG